MPNINLLPEELRQKEEKELKRAGRQVKSAEPKLTTPQEQKEKKLDQSKQSFWQKLFSSKKEIKSKEEKSKVNKKADPLRSEPREKEFERKEIKEVLGEMQTTGEPAVESTSISNNILVIVKHALEGRASAIHIEPGIKESRVRFRVDGVLKTSLVLPKYTHTAMVSRIKTLANLEVEQVSLPLEGKLNLIIDNHFYDFRVLTLPTANGEKVVLKISDIGAKLPSLKELGFNDQQVDLIEKNIFKTNGLVLVTGPRDSGKTSTLYTILDLVNKEGLNIITLEDQVEYYLKGVNQSEINPEIGYDFSSAIKTALEQDPDILMVGETKDNQTANSVVSASLAGHLVFSSLSVRSSLEVIFRLLDMGIKPFLLAPALNLIICQRLVKKICSDCKAEVELPPKLEKTIQEELKNIPQDYLIEIDLTTLTGWQGEGCAHCANTGYKGRIIVAEVTEMTEKMRSVIAKKPSQTELKKVLAEQRFISLRQDCIIKALQGLTTFNECLKLS